MMMPSHIDFITCIKFASGLFVACLFISCGSNFNSKIEFNITSIDKNGLLGPDNGKVSLAYEFCIPQTKEAKEQLIQIDPTINFYLSPGRIQCSQQEYLCIVETKVGWKSTLFQIASLEFVTKIKKSYFE